MDLSNSPDDLMTSKSGKKRPKKMQILSFPCHKEAELLPATEGSYRFPGWCKHFQPVNAVAAFLSCCEGTEQLATDVTFSSVL